MWELHERNVDKSMSGSSFPREAGRSPIYPDPTYAIPTFIAREHRDNSISTIQPVYAELWWKPFFLFCLAATDVSVFGPAFIAYA
jgi:hypothetical protein